MLHFMPLSGQETGASQVAHQYWHSGASASASFDLTSWGIGSGYSASACPSTISKSSWVAGSGVCCWVCSGAFQLFYTRMFQLPVYCFSGLIFMKWASAFLSNPNAVSLIKVFGKSTLESTPSEFETFTSKVIYDEYLLDKKSCKSTCPWDLQVIHSLTVHSGSGT